MKSNKIFLVALVFLIIGLGLMTTSCAMVGLNFERIFNMSYVENNITISGYINTIIVDDSNVKAIVTPSPDGNIHIKYFEDEYDKYNINVDEFGVLDNNDGVLRIIKKQDYRKWFARIFDWSFPVRLEIQIPSNFNGDLNLKTSNSSIKVNNISFNDLYLKTSNSSIVIDFVKSVTRIEAHTSNSKIEITDSSTNGSIYGETSNSGFELRNVTAADDITCTTSNSSISANNVEGKNIYLTTGNSSIKADAIRADLKVLLKTSNSRISATRVRFGERLLCHTSNGTISGTVFGSLPDYTITSTTSNSSNNLPTNYNGGNRIMDIKTSNGRIDFSFLG